MEIYHFTYYNSYGVAGLRFDDVAWTLFKVVSNSKYIYYRTTYTVAYERQLNFSLQTRTLPKKKRQPTQSGSNVFSVYAYIKYIFEMEQTILN